MTLVRRLARPALAAIFVSGGYQALKQPGPRPDMAAPLVEKIAGATGLPNDPELMVRVNGAAMVLGGAALAVGKMPRVASALLIGALAPTTVAGHAFWAEQDPKQRAAQLTQFQKNLGLIGGLLLAAVDTEGRPGLAWRAKDAARTAKREAKLAAKQARQEAKLAAAQARIKVA